MDTKHFSSFLTLPRRVFVTLTAAVSLGAGVPATQAQQCVQPPAGLVGWWPGDGNAIDITGSNNGTLENGATFAPGEVAQAFSFNGAGQFVQVPDSPILRFGPTAPMTVDFWIYRTSSSLTQHFIGKRVTCNADGNGTFQMGLDFVFSPGCGLFFGPPGGSAVCSGRDLPMNTWTHLAGTFDGTTQRLYMNGELIGQIVAPLGPANTEPLLIGGTTQTGQCGQQTTGGRMDEVEIFNRALSQAEIQAIFNAGIAGKCKPPLLNISTRLNVLTGNQVLIGGFIVAGTGSKQVLVLGLGPTLADFGLTGVLADPFLTLHHTDAQGHDTIVATNDNWMVPNQAAIAATGKAPPHDSEAAILQTLAPGNYSAVLTGKSNTTGLGLLEVYDQSNGTTALLRNISTRGFVSTGSNVMIAGFIVASPANKVIVRALGPTLAQFGVTGVLADPVLELHDANGALLAANDNWQQSTQAAQIQASGFAPPNAAEPAIIATRPSGNTTAIVKGKNSATGVALVEVYNLP